MHACMNLVLASPKNFRGLLGEYLSQEDLGNCTAVRHRFVHTYLVLQRMILLHLTILRQRVFLGG